MAVALFYYEESRSAPGLVVSGLQFTPASWPLVVATVSLIWLACYFLCSHRHFATPYLFASAYVLSLCVFHLGLTIPVAFGLVDVRLWDAPSMEVWTKQANWYTALSLGALGVGLAVSINRASSKRRNCRVQPEVAQSALGSVYWDGLGLLVASVFLLAFAIVSVGNLLAFSRVDFFKGVGDTRGLGVFLMTFPSAAVLLMVGARRRSQQVFAGIVAAFAFFLILLSGYRSMALFPALVGVVVWVKSGRRMPTAIAITVIALVVFAIPAVRGFRTLGPYEAMNKDAIVEAFSDVTVEDAFIEMGSTVGVLAHVVRLVPETDPFKYGASYLIALKNAVPNVGVDIAQSTRERASKRALVRSDWPRNLKPSEWLTYRIAPEKFKSGQGVGFSTIGEAYLNFGIPGVIVFFVVIGYALGRIDAIPLLNHPKLLTFAGVMLWPLMKSVRNDLGVFIKPVVFMLIILIMWRFAIHLSQLSGVYMDAARKKKTDSKLHRKRGAISKALAE